jgi:hypothetical protein
MSQRALRALLGPSSLGDEPMEGLYVRLEDDRRLLARAKIVRPEFVEGIGEHWQRRPVVLNGLATG